MTADFVPFVPASTAKTSAPFPARPFTPLTPKAASAAAHVESCSRGGEMKVELKRDGERITQIRVQCRCGELIEIDCEY
jgi:hypothetical protein